MVSSTTQSTVLRAAFEHSGSPAWLMQRIQRQGLDRDNGFALQIDYGDDQWQNGRHATEARLLAGEVDFIDCDWLTLLRCRREGAPIQAAHPYGQILGGLLLRPGLAASTLADLHGCQLGVVNRRDKNWQLLCHHALSQLGLNLSERITLQETGSKTLLANQLASGTLDAALVYWHQIPSLSALGCQLLLEVPDLLAEANGSATTFFLFREALLESRPDLVAGFIHAFEEAKAQLTEDETAWHQIGTARQLSAAQTHRLHSLWQRRIARPWQMADVGQLWALTTQVSDYGQREFTQAFYQRSARTVSKPMRA